MGNQVILVLVLVFFFIMAILFIATNTWYPKPTVTEACNTSVAGTIRFTALDSRVIPISYLFANNTLLSNIYLIDTSCNMLPLVKNYRGVVTGIAFIESYNKSLLAISSYNIGSGGIVGNITVYDMRDNSIAWSLGDIKLRNVTLTGISDPGFVYAGINPSDDVVVAEVIMGPNGFRYEWNRIIDVVLAPQKNNLFLVYSGITNTVVVGAGKSIIVLEYYNGSILLGVKDIGGIIEKISWFWNRYVVLVDDMGVRKILLLYKDKYGLWNYTVIYTSSRVVDVYPIAEKNLIAVAEGPSLDEVYSRNNTSGTLLLIDDRGDVKSEMSIGDTIKGIRGYLYPDASSGPYILVDYVFVNGSTTTYYTSLASPSINTFAWRYSSLKPLRSFTASNRIYVIEYSRSKSVIHCYEAVMASG